MALSASTVWEVRTTGSDANGGGFVTGATGVDYSQQDAAQFALTGIATAGAGAVFLSAAAATTMVGNLLQVVSGTNFTTGIFQILSVVAGVSVTVDRNICTGVGSNGVINIGGALATIGALASPMVAGNIAYVKASGTYSIATGVTFAQTSVSVITAIIGYTTTRGDNGMPLIQASAAISMITLAGDGVSLQNFELDGNSTASKGLVVSNTFSSPSVNLKIHHCTTEGISAAAVFVGAQLEVYSCAGTNGAVAVGSNSRISFLYSHDNTKAGFYTGGNHITLTNCIAESNSGASSDGFLLSGFENQLINCVAYNNGRSGININTFVIGATVYNCIMTGNAAYGLVIPAGSKQMPSVNFNAFYNNTSGARNTIAAGSNDVTLTSDPFISSSGGNFALNTTAGGGAACKAVGFPGVFPGGTSTGYASIGTIQPDPSSGGGGSLIGDGLVSVV